MTEDFKPNSPENELYPEREVTYTERAEKQPTETTKIVPESEAGRTNRIDEVLAKINPPEPRKKERQKPLSEQEKREYIEQHTPDYLNTEEPSFLYRMEHAVGNLTLSEISGKENLPQGAKLFIANHRGGETPKLIGALDEPVHIASAETINWKGNRAVAWVMKKLGMVPIRESFANVPEKRRGEIVDRAGKRERQAHADVVNETNKPKMGSNVENIRRMVALLLQDKSVAIFAEGPFSRLEDDERRAYAGYALVAREYKRVTGEDLPIVPTGIRGKKVAFGDSFSIDKDGKETKEELEEKATERIHNLYDNL